jgi:L-2,4-diaminobutyric acid acetyltransferase
MNKFNLRRPVTEDGVEMYHMVRRCPPLDVNSRYCNLLQASHFSDSSIVAERSGELVGFVTGYRRPDQPEVLFVWQVAVSPDARGERLGNLMLEALVQSDDDIEYMETTVTPSNMPSRKMFQRLAETFDAQIDEEVAFASEPHFENEHEDEVLFRIGPFGQAQAATNH